MSVIEEAFTGEIEFFEEAKKLLSDKEIDIETKTEINNIITENEKQYKATYLLDASGFVDKADQNIREKIKHSCNDKIIKVIEESNIPISNKINVLSRYKVPNARIIKVIEESNIPISNKVDVLSQYKISIADDLADKATGSFFIQLNVIARMIELENDRISKQKSNEHKDNRITPLAEALVSIKKDIEEAESKCKKTNESKERKCFKTACKNSVEKIIKTQLLDDGVLDLSWREKFVRGLLNALMSFSFSRANTGSFFKTKTKAQENIENIQHTLKKIYV